MESPFLFMEEFFQFVVRRKKIISSVLGAFLIVSFGLVWNYFAQIKTSQQAFSKLLKIQKDLDSKNFSEQELIKEMEELYNSYSKAKVSPFFLAYKADLQEASGNKQEAIKTLQYAVSIMPSSTVSDLYRVKLEVLKLDSGDNSLIEDAILKLKSISEYDSSVSSRLATYHLHQYFWVKKDYINAKMYGDQFLFKFGKTAKKDSGFSFYTGQNEYLDQVKSNLKIIGKNV